MNEEDLEEIAMLPESLGNFAVAVYRTYTPKILVIALSISYITKQELESLLLIERFIGLKRITSYKGERIELHFELK